MRITSILVIAVFLISETLAQSPHGNELKIDCSKCHETTNWQKIPAEITFNHDKETLFPLTGQHKNVQCLSCHKSVAFSNIKAECISCHHDIHQNSVGSNCIRCHTTNSWVVNNINEIHERGRFPLTGVHLNVDCSSCHNSYTKYYFPS